MIENKGFCNNNFGGKKDQLMSELTNNAAAADILYLTDGGYFELGSISFFN